MLSSFLEIWANGGLTPVNWKEKQLLFTSYRFNCNDSVCDPLAKQNQDPVYDWRGNRILRKPTGGSDNR